MLSDKNILLCVSGGIAVFKAAALASKLSQEGANVKVIMTESAKKFVTPLTFQAVTRNVVYTDTFDEKDSQVISHIDLADWADIVLVAPATANIIGKLANGIADDMLTTTVLATTADVWIAPAMNVHMFEHPAVKENLKKLEHYNYRFIAPGEGQLACGYIGKGRLAEPEDIISVLKNNYQQGPLTGKKVLITAGPTQEALDPVRYFTNRSSGKMGYAIAVEAKQLGADVTLVSGPTSLEQPSGIEVVSVQTAQQMYEAVLAEYEDCDIFISSAAVADYRPKNVSEQKIKKQPNDWQIQMERTTDILASLGKMKTTQLLVGFAAESEKVEEHAIKKLEKKNLDLIVANNIKSEGAGFQTDTNIVTIYDKHGKKKELPILSKKEVAHEIMMDIVNYANGNDRK